jgi:hypothetical protein
MPNLRTGEMSGNRKLHIRRVTEMFRSGLVVINPLITTCLKIIFRVFA